MSPGGETSLERANVLKRLDAEIDCLSVEEIESLIELLVYNSKQRENASLEAKENEPKI